MNFTLTITASPELLEAIRGLGKFGGSNEPAPKKDKNLKAVPANAPAAEETSAPESKDEVKDQSTDISITLEMVREKVQGIAKAGKREEVKALLTEFGAENVTKLAAKHYADFIKKLETLKAA